MLWIGGPWEMRVGEGVFDDGANFVSVCGRGGEEGLVEVLAVGDRPWREFVVLCRLEVGDDEEF